MKNSSIFLPCCLSSTPAKITPMLPDPLLLPLETQFSHFVAFIFLLPFYTDLRDCFALWGKVRSARVVGVRSGKKIGPERDEQAVASDEALNNGVESLGLRPPDNCAQLAA